MIPYNENDKFRRSKWKPRRDEDEYRSPVKPYSKKSINERKVDIYSNPGVMEVILSDRKKKSLWKLW